jgi:hypothetical protein
LPPNAPLYDLNANDIGGSTRAIMAKPLLRKAYTRDAYAPLLCRGISWACAGAVIRRQNLISKSHSRALPRRFNSRSPVKQTVILDSTGIFSSNLSGVNGFVRYYGFLGNRYREQKLAHCRKLLGMPSPEPPALATAKDYREHYERAHRLFVVAVSSLSPNRSHAGD